LIDARLSDTRDLAAAEAFFRSAWTVTGVAPDRITTDGHNAYPRAIRQVFGNRIIAASSNGIVLWAGSSKGTPPHAFVAPLMKFLPFCARSHSAINPSHSCSAGTSIGTGLVSWRQYWWQRNSGLSDPRYGPAIVVPKLTEPP